MRVAVVTPYYREPTSVLQRCHQSVLAQQYPCDHVMVADGLANDAVDNWAVDHVALPASHNDNGNTPRGLGAISAFNAGYDALAFLDADNWFHPAHIATMVEKCRTSGAAVCFSDRIIILANGVECLFEDDDVLAGRAVDTSCFFVTREAMRLAPVWCLMDPLLAPICDRVLFHAAKTMQFTLAWTGQATVYYESNWPDHYRAMNQPPPATPHNTDWAKIEQQYRAETMMQRLGFDPFEGTKPTRENIGPRCLIKRNRAI